MELLVVLNGGGITRGHASGRAQFLHLQSNDKVFEWFASEVAWTEHFWYCESTVLISKEITWLSYVKWSSSIWPIAVASHSNHKQAARYVAAGAASVIWGKFSISSTVHVQLNFIEIVLAWDSTCSISVYSSIWSDILAIDSVWNS